MQASVAMRIFVSMFLLLLALQASEAVRAAQPCTADSQCAMPGSERRFMCQGSVLVSRERRCLGGFCTYGPETRIDCGGGVGFGNCNSSSGRCRSGTAPITGGGGGLPSSRSQCPPRCICNGKTLIIVTGNAGVKKRCETIEQKCEYGCSCKSEPHCKSAPRTQ